MKKSGAGIIASSSGDWKFKRANLKSIFVELSKGIGKAAGGAITVAAGDPVKGWTTIVTAIPDAVATLTNVGTLTEANRAHTLVQRALASAIAEIVGDTRHHIVTADIVGKGLLEQAGKDSEDAWTLSPAFLERPREVELVRLAQPVLKSWLINHGVSEGMARARVEVLPDVFCIKLHEELARHAPFYEPLLNYLKLQTSTLVREQWEWERYRSSVIALPYEPLFGDEDDMTLSDVFVPLTAYQQTQKNDFSPWRFVKVDAALTEWFDAESRDDFLRVLSGDPGSGKSSCSRMWAAKMARERPGWRILYIPLHALDYNGNLRESLQTYLSKQEGIYADLLASHCQDRVLLCVDGLDELAMAGATAQEAATNFVRHLVGILRNAKGRVRALLGGRELIISQCRNELLAGQVLKLTPYSQFRRNYWWHNYGAVSQRNYTELPKELQREDLDELTRQPLFNYLIALSYNRYKKPHDGAMVLDFSQDITINAIYADLLRSVWERRWGNQNPHIAGTHRSLTRMEFEDLLEEVAVVVWQSGSRTASLKDIEIRCKQEGLTEALEILGAEARKGVIRLLAAFHVRFTGTDTQTVEFTHKSFGEYLAARRIVRLMDDISDRRTHARSGRRANWNPQADLAEWARLCGPTPLDDTDMNQYHFLVREIENKTLQERTVLRDTFFSLIETMIREGMPMEQLGLATFFEMEEYAQNAEEALLCALFATLDPADYIPKETLSFRDPFIDEESYPTRGTCWVRKLHYRRSVSTWRLAAPCVTALYCLRASFLGANLGNSNLSGAYLRRADLEEACLVDAHLGNVELSEANLRRADLRGANLWEANLSSADLEQAILNRANLENANLSKAKLVGTDLRGVDFKEADLSGANLEGALLKGTDFRGAILTGARVTDEQLKEAIMEDSDVVTEKQPIVAFMEDDDEFIDKDNDDSTDLDYMFTMAEYENSYKEIDRRDDSL